MRRLPPLNAVRAFETSARLQSFSRAALELNVTQSAISHQVRTLEDYLNVPLFRRLSNGIELTPEAKRILPVATNAFETLSRAMLDISAKREGVTVHCSTSFALRWLLRRIGQFELASPEIAIRLSSGTVQDEFTPEALDLEVVYETSPPKNKNTTLLLDEWMLPVCSPEYLKGQQLETNGLLEHRLLANDPNCWDWMQWAKNFDIDAAAMQECLAKGISFNADTAAIETAVAGQGIALANLYYVKPELDSGALVTAVNVVPFRLGAHYLVRRRWDSQAIKTFAHWIENCAEETAAEVVAMVQTRSAK